MEPKLHGHFTAYRSPSRGWVVRAYDGMGHATLASFGTDDGAEAAAKAMAASLNAAIAQTEKV